MVVMAAVVMVAVVVVAAYNDDDKEGEDIRGRRRQLQRCICVRTGGAVCSYLPGQQQRDDGVCSAVPAEARDLASTEQDASGLILTTICCTSKASELCRRTIVQ